MIVHVTYTITQSKKKKLAYFVILLNLGEKELFSFPITLKTLIMKKAIFISIALLIGLSAFFAYRFLSTAMAMEASEINIPTIEHAQSLTDLVQPYIDHETTKGLSIGIYNKGQVKYHNYGICSDKNPVLPNKQSIYEIGSITKTFTTAVLAQMVQEGKVQYSDPMSDYLPQGVTNWSTDTITITLEELATHRSGLPRLADNQTIKMLFSMDNPYKFYTMDNLYDFIKSYTPKPKEQRKVDYSNLGMGILGNILANIDQISYEAMIQKRILQPLGMTNTFIDDADKTMITGHNGYGEPTSPWDLPTYAGAGALRSNTEDMMKYLIANIEKESPFSETHVARASYEDGVEIGLAWGIRKYNDGDLILHSHSGGTGGFRTSIVFAKEQEIGVIVMGNSIQDVSEIALRTLQLVEKDEKLSLND